MSDWSGLARMRLLVIDDSMLSENDGLLSLTQAPRNPDFRVVSLPSSQTSGIQIREETRARIDAAMATLDGDFLRFENHPAAVAF